MSVTRCAGCTGETAATGSWAQTGGGRSSACRHGRAAEVAAARARLGEHSGLVLKLHRVLRVERDGRGGRARRAVLVEVEVALAAAVAEAGAVTATAIAAEAGTAGVTENQGVIPVGVVGDPLRHRHGGCQIDCVQHRTLRLLLLPSASLTP